MCVVQFKKKLTIKCPKLKPFTSDPTEASYRLTIYGYPGHVPTNKTKTNTYMYGMTGTFYMGNEVVNNSNAECGDEQCWSPQYEDIITNPGQSGSGAYLHDENVKDDEEP